MNKHIDENRSILLKSIIKSNKSRIQQIVSEYQDYCETQQYIILLLELEYSISEIRILIDMPEAEIKNEIKQMNL